MSIFIDEIKNKEVKKIHYELKFFNNEKQAIFILDTLKKLNNFINDLVEAYMVNNDEGFGIIIKKILINKYGYIINNKYEGKE